MGNQKKDAEAEFLSKNGKKGAKGLIARLREGKTKEEGDKAVKAYYSRLSKKGWKKVPDRTQKQKKSSR